MPSTADLSDLTAALEGRYRVERRLGEGGMATVYLAHDLKHDRPVALKVLRPELAAVLGAERFLAEIRTTANLQHPHILPLFDSGEAGGHLFYVMPYVPGGESLRERLEREGQLPVGDAVAAATSVAHALDYAHRAGVVHRDVKPANILLQDGQPVVADFGIALAVSESGGGRLTETGLSLGTPHYMSPEQATGEGRVGPAADIYALGCVLHEMLAGEPPYTGATVQAVLGKILTGRPTPPRELRPAVPANVDAAVRKALEKLPADRFATASDFADALVDPGFRHGEAADGAAAGSVGRWKATSLLAIGAAAVLSVLWWRAATTPPAGDAARERVATVITMPEGATNWASAGLAISPDGGSLVFRSGDRLWRRDLDRLEARPVSGTESPWMPFFSPDGEWVGYFDQSDNTLKRARPDGSELVTIGPAPSTTRSAGWSEDGTIVFHSSGLGGLSRIRDAGGEPEAIARAAGQIRWLDLLPGGRALLGSPVGRDEVVLVPLDTGEPTSLFPGVTPRYAAGRIVYWREGNLWAVPFDLERLEVSGEPVLVAAGVRAGTNGLAHFAVHDDLLVYLPGAALVGIRYGMPAWVDREGDLEPLAVEPGYYVWPRISPDGTQVALVRYDEGNPDIWIHDLVSGASRRLTFDSAADVAAVWTPDGARLAFSSNRDGAYNLYVRRADGTGGVERLTTGSADQRAYGWTPDGSMLVYAQTGVNTSSDIWTVAATPGAEPRPLMQEAYDETQPALSPDGRWLAYQSSELGYPEIFVRPFPDLGGKWLVSTLDVGASPGVTGSDPREAYSPVWSRDGSALYYQSANTVVRVPVSTGATFTHGAPERWWSTGGMAIPRRGPEYDVASGEERLLAIVIGTSAAPRSDLVVVQNWAAVPEERSR